MKTNLVQRETAPLKGSMTMVLPQSAHHWCVEKDVALEVALVAIINALDTLKSWNSTLKRGTMFVHIGVFISRRLC